MDELCHAEGEDAEGDIEAGLTLGHALAIGSRVSQSSRDASDDVSHYDVDCEVVYKAWAYQRQLSLDGLDMRKQDFSTKRQHTSAPFPYWPHRRWLEIGEVG